MRALVPEIPDARLAASRRPENGPLRLPALLLGVAAFFITWRVIRFDSINMTLADVVLLGTAMLLLVRGRLTLNIFAQNTAIYILGLVLMLGGLLAGSIANGDPVRWGVVSSQYLFAWLVVPMVLASFDPQWLRRCMVLFVIGVALSQLIGGLATLHPSSAALLSGLSQGFFTGNGRVGAMTGEPNPNGAMCTVAFIFLLNGLQQRTMSRRVALVCAALLAWGIIGSASFTAVAAVTLCLLFMLVASGPSALAKFGLPVALFVSVYLAAGGPLPETFHERVASAIVNANPDEAGTFAGRSLLMAEAWGMLDDNLLIGTGADGYRTISGYGAPVHNFHLLIANEGGLVGYLGLILMSGVVLTTALGIYRRDRQDGAMCLALGALHIVYTMAVAHMYDRIWIAPIILAVCACSRPAGAGSIAQLRLSALPRYGPHLVRPM